MLWIFNRRYATSLIAPSREIVNVVSTSMQPYTAADNSFEGTNPMAVDSNDFVSSVYLISAWRARKMCSYFNTIRRICEDLDRANHL